MKETGRRSDFLKLSLQRAFGMRFVLSMVLVCFAFFLDTEVSARNVLLGIYPPAEYDEIFTCVENIFIFGMNYKLYLVFMTIGFAAVVPLDFKAGILPRIVKDLGLRKYAGIAVGLSALSGGLSVMGGFILYFLCMKTKLPLLAGEPGANGVFQALQGKPYCQSGTLKDLWLFFLFLLIILFFAGATVTAFTAGLSLWLKNNHLVMIFPYLLSRGYIEMAKVLQLPDAARIDRWFTARVQPFPIPVCLGIMGVLCLLTYLFSKQIMLKSIKWRLLNGWI